MKILHFLTSISTGGAEKFCVDLANTQSMFDNLEVHICVLDEINEKQLLIKQISNQVNLISLNKKGGYDLKIITKIYKLLEDINPDFIHINGRALIYTSIPILLKKIPSVYTVHTFAHKEYNKYFKMYNKLLFTFFPKLFTPVAISKTVLETIKSTYGQQFNELIYNGSSPLKRTNEFINVQKMINSLKVNEDTLVFLYIGRIAPEKNTLLLIESFNKLLDKNENIVLCIIGYDSTIKKDYITKCIKTNRYQNKIKFLGQRNNVADYLSAVDALCLTSIYEGLGIVGLEAFSLGIPILSTPSGGPSEIIDSSKNGYISKEQSVESYIEMIKIFIEKPIVDKELIINNYKRNYTMKECAMSYIKLYEMKINV